MKNIQDINAIDLHVAQKLRRLRSKAGFSQKKLAECAGISFQQVQKYESVKNKISTTRLFEFSQILQTSVSSFFDGMKCKSTKYSNDVDSSEIEKGYYSLVLSIKDCLPLIEAYGRIENEIVRENVLNLVRSISTKEFENKKNN